MKRIVNLLILGVAMIACSSSSSNTTLKGTQLLGYGELPYGITMQKFGGCEYLLTRTSNYSTTLIHHAGCNNPIHKPCYEGN